MSKYYAPLNIAEKNASQVKILEKISQNSRVLEFGPADGYMTQYMKEKLHCDVFIVELDEESYKTAIEFAFDGFCGNIEKYEWENKLAGQTFDYILFADVLEHLYDPWEALKRSAQFLGYAGRVLVSLPNIAHSAVIISLLQNKFPYRSTGLLDETHIRFFTFDSAVELCNRAGLTPVTYEATYIFPESTEFANQYSQFGTAFEKLLIGKQFGTVYQFVFECVASHYHYMHGEDITIKKSIEDIRPSGRLTLFAECDGVMDGFNTIEKSLFYGYGEYNYDIKTHNPPPPPRVRINAGDRPCYVILHELTVNGKVIEANDVMSNADAQVGSVFMFNRNDPHFFAVDENNSISTVSVKLQYEPYIYQDWFKFVSESINKSEYYINERNHYINESKHYINESKHYMLQYNNVINSTCWKLTAPLRRLMGYLRKS